MLFSTLVKSPFFHMAQCKTICQKVAGFNICKLGAVECREESGLQTLQTEIIYILVAR